MTTPNDFHTSLCALAAAQGDGVSMYALLDSAVYASETASPDSERYGSLAEQFADADVVPLFSYAFRDTGVEASPLLVKLPTAESELCARTIGLAERYRLASWLWSPASSSVLAQHLATFLRAELDNTAVMLRPFDPRIMEDTIACLHPARQAALWEPVTSWSYLADDNVVKMLPRPSAQPLQPVTAPLILDPDERKRLEGLAARIALDGYIEAHTPTVLQGMSADERKAFCQRQLSIGETLGAESMGELLVIATLSKAHGAQWVENAASVPLIESIKAGGTRLLDVAQRIDEQLNQLHSS